MSNSGYSASLNASLAPQRLKYFTHQILAALAKASPIWGYPAVIAGDNYPFVNQRAERIPTIFLDIEAPELGDAGMRVLGTLLTEAIRLHSDKAEDASALGLQLLTMNNGPARFTLIVQALNAKDPYDLIACLSLRRDLILGSAFEIIEHLGEDTPPHSQPVYQ